jgi:hypothetical protein
MTPRSRFLRAGVRALAAAAASATVFAGCGGAADLPRVDERRAAATQRTDVERIARDSLLTTRDFPAGWAATGAEPSLTVRCGAAVAARRGASARANSPTFSADRSTAVSQTVYVFADESAAARSLAALTATRTRSCLAAQLHRRLARSSTAAIGKPRSARLATEPLGDDRDAARIRLPAGIDGRTIDVVFDLAFVRVGRALQIVVFADTIEPFDAALRERLTAEAADRLRSNIDR